VAPGRVQILNGGLDLYAPDTRGQAVNGFQAYDAGDFLDAMQAANPRVWEALDLWASHAYPLGPFAAPPGERQFQIDDLAAGRPRTTSAAWPGLYNRGINAYQWELYKLRSFGLRRRLPVIITETGWRHTANQAESEDRHGAVNDPRRVATYLELAFRGDPTASAFDRSWTPWEEDDDVVGVVIFAAGGDPARWGHTNLFDVGPRGEVLRIKAGFRLLEKP
jgi:hypothetical protein